ncbi:CPBP family intramembrane glutamic endopeptidase [Nocardia harenae]|uniref:CPBP family intramembrane glutamic endopeptidase n=1 Tax=Nocardia harenae TaxID=358707 RepID=UPI0012EDFB73|nr:CPBP family intramembrane glutamic endopeptidase [Nocardia harenae]
MRLSRRQLYLGAEFALLFGGGAALYNARFRGTSPIPVLIALGAGVTRQLRRSATFDRRAFWRAGALRPEAGSMALLAGASAAALTGAVAAVRPADLFELPRRHPGLWAAVMVLYPVLSVYPQELVFRAFVFDRYAPVFGDGTAMIAASAAAFGIVHIAFGSWISVLLSGAGGVLFALRYRRTGSLFAATVEHSIYGVLVFTVGLGRYFYHGAAEATLAAAAPAAARTTAAPSGDGAAAGSALSARRSWSTSAIRSWWRRIRSSSPAASWSAAPLPAGW